MMCLNNNENWKHTTETTEAILAVMNIVQGEHKMDHYSTKTKTT